MLVATAPLAGTSTISELRDDEILTTEISRPSSLGWREGRDSGISDPMPPESFDNPALSTEVSRTGLGYWTGDGVRGGSSGQ
ncbi:hypothetical protein DTO013E5_10204 [Penicillium roqueforti]|nr:hypothetical protein DTO013F2_10622 [Penicillium roqueforti]KAI3195350.1 hypothetical protein DTO013E5_10204 [Penicillium roqueforti]